MELVALAALVQAQPEGVEAAWLAEALGRHWREYRSDAPGRVRAWSVGGVQDNETLVQARPVVRDPRADFLADLLRAPTPTTLAAFATRHDREPLPAIAMTRFQRWIGVRAEGELSSDPAARTALTAALPDFLVRSSAGGGDRELAVFGFLAALQADGGLGKAYATPSQIRRALAAVDERLGRPPRINLVVSDGRTVGVLHRGGRFVALEPPAPARPRAIAAASRATAALLLFDPDPQGELAGARLLPEGVFTVTARQPGAVEQGP